MTKLLDADKVVDLVGRLPCECDPAYSVRRCGVCDLKEAIRSLPAQGAPTPDPAAAVIAAAEAHRSALAGLCSLSESEQRLCRAVDAYRASRQPQGVRPEEVEPGTRFRFVHNNLGDAPYIMLDGRNRCVCTDSWMVLGVGSDDRIIPLHDSD